MKKCKECGREETGYGSLLDEDGYCFTCGVKYSQEKIKRLQEQLKEANHILKDVFISDAYYKSKQVQYKIKWGVK